MALSMALGQTEVFQRSGGLDNMAVHGTSKYGRYRVDIVLNLVLVLVSVGKQVPVEEGDMVRRFYEHLPVPYGVRY